MLRRKTPALLPACFSSRPLTLSQNVSGLVRSWTAKGLRTASNRSTSLRAVLAAVAVLAAGISSVVAAPAALELASPFVDDAILQRQMPVPVWGWARPGDEVTVDFAGQSRTVKAGEDGTWKVELAALEASTEPRAMTVRSETAGKTLEVKGVLVGEVWLSSGQSNMHWVAHRSMCREIASSLAHAETDIPIREFEVDIGSSVLPQERVQAKAGWKRAKDAGGFSALSLSFAHKLYEELGVPVGLLRSTHGATPIETWTPYVGFASHPKLRDIALRIRQADPSTPDGKAAYKQFYAALRQWQVDSEAIMNRGGKALPRPKLPGIASAWKGAGRMFNKKINGLAPYALRGMIWCQGTHNARDGRIYADKMAALVSGIRHVWDRPDLPFYFTQQQAYGNVDPDKVGHADLRQVQTLFFTRNIDKHVGMALQHDLNSARPQGIHNFNKLHPGWRLARWALSHDYGREDLPYTGPLYKSHKIAGKAVRVTFEQPGPGGALMVGSKGMAKDYREPGKYVEPARPTPGEALTHFRLAGADGKWHAAKAVIDGMDVIVTSEAVPEPVGVQYAYSAVPMGANLYNEAGLPALSFAVFDGKPVFQEDLRAPETETTPKEEPARRPYVSIMTPFRNGVVVQRDQPAPVWGFAVPGETVTVKFAGQTKTATVDEFDRWRVTLNPMPANATGRDLVVSSSDGATRTVRNVVVGDLWFVTGTRALSDNVLNKRDKDAEVPPDMPLLREFRSRTKARKHYAPRKRRMEIGGGRFTSRWVTAVADQNGLDITAVAYNFAKRVRKDGVPVGIINMGSDNPPLTWMSYEGLQVAKGFEAERDKFNRAYPNTEAGKRAVENYIDTLKAWCDKIVPLRRAGRAVPPELAEKVPAFPAPYYNQWAKYTETPTHTYNFVVAPNTPLAVRGVVWIPSKTNLGKDLSRYAAALEAYAASLPGTYDQKTVPFVYAQPSLELMTEADADDNDDVRRPKIDGAASVEFESWPNDLGRIAAKLGTAAMQLK